MLFALLTCHALSAAPLQVPTGFLAQATTDAAEAPRGGASRPVDTPEAEYRKTFHPLLSVLALGVSAAGAYAGLATGVLANASLGALSWPPDRADVALLALLPAAVAATSGWLVGLLDLKQRSVVGSLLWSAVGAVVGEAAGLGIGFAVGRTIAPGDFSASASIAIVVAPLFAALGAVAFSELFKPGELTSTGRAPR